MCAKKRKHAPPPATTDAEGMKPVVRVHIWLETVDGVAFGMGRLLLLDAIEETGSLKAAAEQLGMSYRAAWGKIKSTERRSWC